MAVNSSYVPGIRETVITINGSWCKKCGICAAFCKKNVLVQHKDKTIGIENSENCVGCRTCINLCPDYAISLEVKEQ